MKDKLGRFLCNWRINEVLPYIKGDLLDIGCGTNQLVNSYKGKGIGVDIYPWEKDVYVIKDASNLPFKDKNFDTVTIIAALNHISNREEVLFEVNRILKDDGLFIITMIPPVISRIWHFARRPWDSDQTERGMSNNEVYGFYQSKIQGLFSKGGFKIILQKHFMMRINCVYIANKMQDWRTVV